MDKKALKTLSQNIRRVLIQNNINNELAYDTFFNYIFSKVLIENNIIKNEGKSYVEVINECQKKFPYYFSDSYLDLNAFIDTNLKASEYQNVESLGWLYQYFQAEIKEKAKEGESKKYTDDKIPITTQVFTPKWICKYMLNNTLGKLLGYKDLDYFLESKEKSIDIEAIKVLDPCMGTGNILIYAFELLMRKYVDLGYSLPKAAKMIIYNNLYGFEIDEKAYKVALFSLRVLCLKYGLKDIKEENIHIYLIKNTLGSLINEPLITLDKNIQKALQTKYDVVCTNPPYMGKKNLNKEVSKYLEQKYPLGKSELYAAFIIRCLEFAKDERFVSMITIHSWMFISSFEKLRNYIIDNYYLQSMAHTGANTFQDLNGFNALATSFIIKKEPFNKRLTTFIRLANYYDYETKKKEFYNHSNYYFVDVSKFKAIPGVVFDYYVNQKIIDLFKNNQKIKDLFALRQGLATGNNKKYVHYWYEVDKEKIKFDCRTISEALESNYLYFPYNKGGNFSKWYVSCENVIRFDKQAFSELSNQGNKLPSRKYYFQKGITWSLFGFENFAVKYKDYGYIFDVSGSSLFVEDKYLFYVLGFLASNLSFHMLSLLAPTVNFQVGNIGNLPIIINDDYLLRINELVEENIKMCKENWDNQDISWDFQVSPYLKYGKSNLLEENFNIYRINQNNLCQKLKANEEELNKIYNKIYDIDFITNEVVFRDLTIKPLDEIKEIKNLLNYLIGIVLGRYQLKGYNHYDFIELSLLETELKLVLKILFGENNDNYHYLDKLDLNKYLFNDYKHGLLDYLNKRFKKNPIYYIIKIDNKDIIFNVNKLQKTVDSLLKTQKLVFTEDDSTEVKLKKLDNFLKMYTKI